MTLIISYISSLARLQEPGSVLRHDENEDGENRVKHHKLSVQVTHLFFCVSICITSAEICVAKMKNEKNDLKKPGEGKKIKTEIKNDLKKTEFTKMISKNLESPLSPGSPLPPLQSNRLHYYYYYYYHHYYSLAFKLSLSE